jgi:hypothetical protein
VPDPWWLLGWLLVTCIGGALAACLLLVCAALAIAVHHGVRVTRDTQQWDAERPRRSTWRRVALKDGSLQVVVREDGHVIANALGSSVTHRLKADGVAAWLHAGNWRRTDA